VRRPHLGFLAAWLVAVAGLASNTASDLTAAGDTYWLRLPRRHWQDLHLGIGLFTHGLFPVTSNEVVRERDEAGGVRYREKHPDMERTVAGRGIQPWEFWRTVPSRRVMMRERPALSQRFDDSGRPLLLGLGFQALGGIAPFLLPWLGLLVALPVVLWASAELHASGHAAAAVTLGLLLGVSCYFAGVLRTTYAPAGFYVVSLLGLGALASYAALGRPTCAGLLMRALGSGVVFGVCLLCRGSVAFELPAYLAALTLAVWRLGRQGSPVSPLLRVAVGALAVALFALPGLSASLAARRLVARTFVAYGQAAAPPQRHALWFGVWAGLGDFDRERGYQWLDAAVNEAVARQGGTPIRQGVYDPGNEVILRAQVLRDVRQDPLWYGGILLRRLGATLTQSKLWPWGPLGGVSIEPAGDPNGRAIDEYYTLTPTLDTLGVGPYRGEVPMPLLVAPALLFPVLALRRRGVDPGMMDALIVLALLAAGSLAMPVAITTASAPETQAFGVFYLWAAALLADSLLRGRRQKRSASARA